MHLFVQGFHNAQKSGNGASRRLSFGPFTVDLQAEELWKEGSRVRIQRQPFQVLSVLLETPGNIVSRENLQKRVWNNAVNVDFDLGLNAAVKKLREALDDSTDAPIYIQTIARRGYRFIAVVHENSLANGKHGPVASPPAVVAQDDAPFSRSSSFAMKRRLSNRWLALGGASAIVLLVALWWLLASWGSRAPVAHVLKLTHSDRVTLEDSDTLHFPAVVTDGSRIFYTVLNNGRMSLQSVSVNGGVETSVSLPSGLLQPEISDISRDGTKLLMVDLSTQGTEHPLWIVPTSGGSGLKFAGGLAHAATWTRDGLHLVIATENELRLADEDGSHSRLLTKLPSSAYWLRWSKNDIQLGFTLVDGLTRKTSLWAVDEAGQSLRHLSPNDDAAVSSCCISWRPDGRRYLFQSSRGDFGFSTNIWNAESWVGFWTRSPSFQRVTDGPGNYQNPVSTASGREMFLIGENRVIEDRVLDVVHGAISPFHVSGQSPRVLDVSSDGKWIAWVRSEDSTLWKSRVGTNEAIELVQSPLQVQSVRWSPDSSFLAFTARYPSEVWKVFVMPSTGGAAREIAPDSVASKRNPDWSPDGKSLFFEVDRHSSSSITTNLVSFDVQTSHATSVVGSKGMTSPHVSSDGILAALMANTVMLQDRQTGSWRRLSNRRAGQFIWSRTRPVLFIQADLEAGKPIYKVETATGREEKIAAVPTLLKEDYADVVLIGVTEQDEPIVCGYIATANILSLTFR